jgi:hypothetical protein
MAPMAMAVAVTANPPFHCLHLHIVEDIRRTIQKEEKSVCVKVKKAYSYFNTIILMTANNNNTKLVFGFLPRQYAIWSLSALGVSLATMSPTKLMSTIIHLFWTILGVTLGVGLGLGLAMHVYDQLQRLQQARDLETEKAKVGAGNNHNNNARSILPARANSSSHSSTTGSSEPLKPKSSSLRSQQSQILEDVDSYESIMESAGYHMEERVLRGQVVRASSGFWNHETSGGATTADATATADSSCYYPFTNVPVPEQRAVLWMKEDWPNLPDPVLTELGRFVEHVMRDYISGWYTKVDKGVVYREEKEKRENGIPRDGGQLNNNNNNNSSKKSSKHNPEKQPNEESNNKRRMVFRTPIHRQVPFIDQSYRVLSVVFGNLATRVEHINVFSLALLKWTHVVAHTFKQYRILRKVALDKQQQQQQQQQEDPTMQATTTTATSGSTTNGSNSNNGGGSNGNRTTAPTEIQVAREFLLARKLHRAVTFGLDVPSLLFADASGKECGTGTDQPASALSDDQVLEQRLFHTPMLKDCEVDYNRVLAHRLCRALLPRQDFNSTVVSGLVVEIFAGCVLQPLMNCFCPLYLNGWIISGMNSMAGNNGNNGSGNGGSGNGEKTDTDTNVGQAVQEGTKKAVQVAQKATEQGAQQVVDTARKLTKDISQKMAPSKGDSSSSSGGIREQVAAGATDAQDEEATTASVHMRGVDAIVHGVDQGIKQTVDAFVHTSQHISEEMSDYSKKIKEGYEEAKEGISSASSNGVNQVTGAVKTVLKNVTTPPTEAVKMVSEFATTSLGISSVAEEDEDVLNLENMSSTGDDIDLSETGDVEEDAPATPLLAHTSGDHILTLAAMSLIELQQYVDFDECREAKLNHQEVLVDWNDVGRQTAILNLVLLIENAILHGRCFYLDKSSKSSDKLSSSEGEASGGRELEEEAEQPTIPQAESISQVLMEMTSNIDAFENRVNKLNNELPEKRTDDYNGIIDVEPDTREVSTLRTLISTWLHTGQLYRFISVIIKAHRSLLRPFYDHRAFLAVDRNADGFARLMKALDGVDVMVDTMAVLASKRLDPDSENDDISMPSSPAVAQQDRDRESPQRNDPKGEKKNRLQLSLLKAGLSVARFQEELLAVDVAAQGTVIPRFLDFHKNSAFAASLRSERDRRMHSWATRKTTDSVQPIHHKGAPPAEVELFQELHNLSRIFYNGTNVMAVRDAARRKDNDEPESPMKGGDSEKKNDNKVALLTVEMASNRRRIEVPDDDSSFLLRAQVRNWNTISDIERARFLNKLLASAAPPSQSCECTPGRTRRGSFIQMLFGNI